MILDGYRFVDFFCNIGATRLAFTSQGAESVFANDFHPKPKFLYDYNFNYYPANNISKIPVGNLPAHDICCINFSMEFLNKTFVGSHRLNKFNKKTVDHILENICYHKPKVVIIHCNCSGLKNNTKDYKFDEVLNFLIDNGYHVKSKIFNFYDYGCPFSFKRIFFVFFKDLNHFSKFNFPQKTDLKLIKDFLDDNIESTEHVNCKIKYDPPLVRNDKVRISALTENNNYIFSNKSIFPNLKKTGKILIEDNHKKIRKLSCKELLKMKGFPKEYKILDENCFSLISNNDDIPVQLMTEIAKSVGLALKKFF